MSFGVTTLASDLVVSGGGQLLVTEFAEHQQGKVMDESRDRLLNEMETVLRDHDDELVEYLLAERLSGVGQFKVCNADTLAKSAKARAHDNLHMLVRVVSECSRILSKVPGVDEKVGIVASTVGLMSTTVESCL